MLTTGSRLGPYEIVLRLGAGGMGEVFKARDTRLDRSVAIKILPEELARNAQFRIRFEREARAISQLNHPNICTLHDVGEGYLVMELIEGESIADRLRRGPMPLAQVLEFGAQIADALDRAHRAGIVHRDLKPGNVMLTKSGAKLLDFGLAKSSPVVSPSLSSETPSRETEHRPLTAEGTILGTFQYMAPEQLEGAEADARTDIFALGALLYEMSTGTRAFDGKTRTSLIAAIVKDEPRPIREIQPLTPPAFEHVVQRCLSKDPDDRWQSAHDIAQELRWIAVAGSQAGVPAVTGARRRVPARVLAVAGALGLAAAAGIGAFLAGRQSAAIPAVRFEFQTPQKMIMVSPTLTVSPDGRLFAFVLKDGDKTRIYVRSLNALQLRAVPGTENAASLFFSHDGSTIAFVAGGKLRRVAVAGGPVTDICDSKRLFGGVWLPDDTIVFCPWFDGPLYRVPAAGGAPVAFTKIDPSQKDAGHTWPAWLPGRDEIIFTREHSGKPFNEASLVVQPLDGGPERVLLRGGYRPQALDRDTLLFMRGSTLFALDMRQPDPSPVEVQRGVHVNPTTGASAWAVGAGRVLAFVSGDDASDRRELLLGDLATRTLRPVTSHARLYQSAAVSPDGSRLALSISDANDDIWTYDLRRDLLSRLTFEAENFAPVWSSNGREIIFTSNRAGSFNLYALSADGGGAIRRLTNSVEDHEPGDVAPDGTIVLTKRDANLSGDIYLLPSGGGTPTPLVISPFDDVAGTFSPDGRWLAYSSDESGRPEVYVRSVRGSGKWQISTNGGTLPNWDATGRAVLFAGTSTPGIFSVAVEFGPEFSASRATMVFPFTAEHQYGGWDRLPNGNIICTRAKPERESRTITVATNFGSEVHARMGR